MEQRFSLVIANFRSARADDWLTSEVRVEMAVVPIEKLYLIRTRCEATPQNFWAHPG